MDEEQAQCAEAPNQPKYIGPHYAEIYWEWKDRQDADPIEVLADTIDHNKERQLNLETASEMHMYGVVQKLESHLNKLDEVATAHSLSFVHAADQRGSLMEVQEQQQKDQDDLDERVGAVMDMNKEIMSTLGRFDGSDDQDREQSRARQEAFRRGSTLCVMLIEGDPREIAQSFTSTIEASAWADATSRELWNLGGSPEARLIRRGVSKVSSMLFLAMYYKPKINLNRVLPYEHGLAFTT